MLLLFAGKAEVVEEYANRIVRSVSQEFKVPSIIRSLKKLRGKIWKRELRFSRENVYTRDGGHCQYCNVRVSGSEATYDHVLPKSRGGTSCWTNIVICCVPCNQKKGGHTPEEVGMRLLKAPVKPEKRTGIYRIRRQISKDTPSSWGQWLRDVEYWHGELEHTD